MSELLTLNDISVDYGNIRALKNVSMHVNEGDIVCLIGANGAGKSTLLKAIVNLEPLKTGVENDLAIPMCEREKMLRLLDALMEELWAYSY